VLGAAALALLVVAGATGSRAAATTPETKWFTTAVVPTPVAPGATGFAFALSNHPTSKQTFGAANATLPAGLTGTVAVASQAAVSSSSGTVAKTWTARYDGATRVIELRAADGPQNQLAPGETVTAAVTAGVPCGYDQTISTIVRQSNKFLGSDNEFLPLPGEPVATIRSLGSGTASLSIAPDPIGTPEVDKPFTVTVTATDACGNSGTGSVALSLLPGANTGQLSAPNPDTTAGAPARVTPPAAMTLTDGTATFSGLQIDKSGTGYKLRATWNAVTEDTDGFEVVDKACDPKHVECTLADGTTEITTKSDKSSPGLMRLSFVNVVGCASGGRQLGSAIKIDPKGYIEGETILITQRWFKSTAPGTGVANFALCLGKDFDATLGIVPKCLKNGGFPTDADGNLFDYCELKRSRDGVGALVITYKIDAQDPGAGLFEFG
jgi:hypothetical protein